MIPRVALIGVTGYGTSHLAELTSRHRENSIELKVAVVINPAVAEKEMKQMRELGVEIFADSAEMFEKYRGQIELCCLPTSIPSHRPLSIAAMEHGMNVLVEKPLAVSTADVEAIQDAERRTGLFTAVGFQWIYLPTMSRLKKLFLSKELGALREVRLLCLWPRDKAYFTRNHWAGRLKTDTDEWVLDSPLQNAMAHSVNLMLFLAGGDFESSARVGSFHGGLYRCQEIESFDTASIEAQTENGVRMQFNVTHSVLNLRGPEWKFLCEKGEVHFNTDGQCSIHREGKPVEEWIADDWRGGARARVFDSVLRRISDPSQWICSTQIAGAHTYFIERMHEFLSIQPVHADAIGHHEAEDSAQIHLHGVEESLTEAFESGKLFAPPLHVE